MLMMEIHAISDESEKAYATNVYLRAEYETNEVDVGFITAKVKFSPIEARSIPRLELVGACLIVKPVDLTKYGILKNFTWLIVLQQFAGSK